ncbi:phytoene desaturase family protein [Sorangium sp. So ce1153]|uniref:phytoene desaturase family protein n=1 Tax=Sorangium sp. So ce1153 TaxID=3133333 RepID=UPI003F603C9C
MNPASPGARRDTGADADADVLVIGAGFGGLGAALSLAERGAKVVLCEALRYPGGCASTFERGGYRFESGATLFSGLAPEQLFGRWIARHGLDVAVDWIDPLVELRTPSLRLSVGRDREALVGALAGLPGAPARGIRDFFAYQARIADTLWAIFDDPALLPPLGAGALLRHAASTPRYAALLPVLGRPLERVLARFGVAEFAPLRQYLDGLCQITVQCGVAEAEAPFAMASMDYYFRGTGHVRGGIGALAWALARAVERLGGEVRMASRVRSLEAGPGGFRAATRSGGIRARQVIANLLPQDLGALLGAAPGALPRLERLARDVEGGWGAAMLYLVARAPEGASPAAHHLELVQDPRAPFTEGNHLFVSVSGAADEGRAPPGHRTLTVSTHVPLARHRALSPGQQGDYIGGVQARMREGLAALAPEWSANVVHALTASPRTFARFTGRAGGAVGGVPRRAGLGHYLSVWPRPVQDGLWMVGDSVFPGQSTLATAIGGVRTAESVARRLGLARGGG